MAFQNLPWPQYIIGCHCLVSSTHYLKETVAYCKKYTEQYIKDELLYFQWLQLTIAKVEQIESERQDFDRNVAY